MLSSKSEIRKKIKISKGTKNSNVARVNPIHKEREMNLSATMAVLSGNVNDQQSTQHS